MRIIPFPLGFISQFTIIVDWEQRKLGSLFNTYSGMTPLRSDLSNFENPTIPWIKTTDLNNTMIENNEEKISDKAASKLRLLPKDTVLIAMYGGFNQIGRTGLLSYSATINQALIALEPIKDIKQYFLLTQLNYRVNDWKRLAASSRKDPNITKKDVENFVLYYPSIEEQNKVSKLFEILDSAITLHQRKLDALKRLKEAYLESMFPRKGESVPKLRFAIFSETWEQRKLGELAYTFSGGTPSASNKAYYNGDIPFIRSGEINSVETELFITEEALNKSSAKLVNEGDILYALYGATSGEVGISQINGAINQAVLAIKPRLNDNAFLIAQWLKKQKEIIINTYLQGGQGNLSGSIVKNLIIDLPLNKDEQTKIGNLLKKIDDTISLHQRKLEHLQNLKKAYLQKMFI